MYVSTKRIAEIVKFAGHYFIVKKDEMVKNLGGA